MTPKFRDQIIGGVIGLVVGDALGVPVEFFSRESLRHNPVSGMRGYGTHGQPAGTWSDDSSLALVTLQSLLGGYSPKAIMTGFQKWRSDNHMTPHGQVFDIGVTTAHAIRRAAHGVEPVLCGGASESENGNGSLMRILPLSIFVSRRDSAEIIRRSFEISSLTHAHFRSRLCCAYYSLLVRGILDGMDLERAMQEATRDLDPAIPPEERKILASILDGTVLERDERYISSGGYVVHTLEASLWCCHRYPDFSAAVLAAVNLGADSDTTGAVTGGLAGLIHGFGSIPQEWVEQLARSGEVLRLATACADLVEV